MSTGSQKFRTETRRLLDIVVNSLYSHPDVFLRELVSNSSDALDRLRFESLTDPGLLGEQTDLSISLVPDRNARTLAIRDNGIGMTQDELVRNLGTIAGSGTSRFLAALDRGDAPELIGRFGVGFYSAFMVADMVEVHSRRAGSTEGASWESDGRETFSAGPFDCPHRGTEVILHLKEGMDEYLDGAHLGRIVEMYSDYVPHPILLEEPGREKRVLNSRTPLWVTPEKDVKPGEYEDFFRHLTHGFEEPLGHLVYRAEGVVEFHALLFLPGRKPFEALMPDWRNGIDLYSRRVRIVESCPDLLPPYLRFVRGVVESSDLPLNISREMLQQSPVLKTMGKALTRRVLDWLAGMARDDRPGYAGFFAEFGDFIKEGLLTDRENRDALAGIVLAWSTAGPDAPVLLTEFVAKAPPDGRLFYVTGTDRKAMAASPHLESVGRTGTDVLLFDGPMDGMLIPALSEALGRKFVPLDREEDESDLSVEERERRDAAAERLSGLLEYMTRVLSGKVRDVRVSTRLSESPCIVVPDRNDPGEAFRGFMKAMKQEMAEMPGVLEVNPDHPLLGHMQNLFETSRSDGRLERCVRLVLQMGQVFAGIPPSEPAAFAADIAGLLMEEPGRD